MAATDNNNSTLSALIAAALALPALSGTAEAADPVTAARMQYHYNNYHENALPTSKLARGSASRYKIDTHQIDIKVPLLAINSDIDITLQHETMTGASPWYVEPDANGKPVQVMSGATSSLNRTITEERNSIQTKFNFFHDRNRLSLINGYSKEKDYRSINIGIEAAREFNQGMTTLEAGSGFIDNSLTPTDASKYQRKSRYGNHETTLYAGITQIINRHSLVQFSVNYSQENGFLSDPYKFVFLGTQLRPDNRPERRRKFAFMTRFRYYLESLHAAVHTDYRYYQDTWGIDANTLTLSWHQSLPHNWKIIPSIRYYTQTQANFYLPFSYGGTQRNVYTSDYRLSPFGSVSGSLQLKKQLGKWQLGLTYERYRSAASYSWKQVNVENPGLVDFQVFSANIDYLFGD